jgi:hypothetical protein
MVVVVGNLSGRRRRVDRALLLLTVLRPPVDMTRLGIDAHDVEILAEATRRFFGVTSRLSLAAHVALEWCQ